MQRTIKATPERLFADAQAFMINQGATIADRSETSITFVAKQGLGTGDYVTAGLLSLYDLAAAGRRASRRRPWRRPPRRRSCTRR
jgi:hypothetical protein